MEYWKHQKSGEIWAVKPDEELCIGPLYSEEVGEITENDERWDHDDFQWLNEQPCDFYEKEKGKFVETKQ